MALVLTDLCCLKHLVGVILITWCAAVHVFGGYTLPEGSNLWQTIRHLYVHGVESGGAGLIGGAVGEPLARAAGVSGARIIVVLCLFVFFMFLTGTSLIKLFRTVSKPAVKIREVAVRRQEERRILEESRVQIDIPMEDVLPQHPVRSIPEVTGENNKKKKECKQHSQQVNYITEKIAKTDCLYTGYWLY